MLANVYADLGTWGGFTPFVGVGIGGSRNTINNFMDICTTCPGGGVAHGPAASKFNFAWAVHAGIAYKVTNNVTIEFAYRYVDLGDALTGDLVTYLGQNSVNNPMHFRNITSHDFKFGVRWMLDRPMQEYDYPPTVRLRPCRALSAAADASRLNRTSRHASGSGAFRWRRRVCGLAMTAAAHAADPPGAVAAGVQEADLHRPDFGLVRARRPRLPHSTTIGSVEAPAAERRSRGCDLDNACRRSASAAATSTSGSAPT